MTRGSALILAAALLWGTTGTAQALGPDTSNPLAVGTVRLLIGAVGLVAIAAATGRLRGALPVAARPLMLTATGIAAYQPAFFGGVSRAGVALGTVVAIGSAPLFAGLLSRAAGLETLRPVWWRATVLGVAGAALIAGGPDGIDPLGVALALGAGAAYALYALGAKQLLADTPPLTAMALGFGAGALLLAPVLLFVDVGWLAEPQGVAMAAWLGPVTVTVSYVLFGYGLRLTAVSTTATLSLAEPLTAMVLGVLILDERPSVTAWVGAALITTGLMLLTIRRTAARPTGLSRRELRSDRRP